MARALRVEYEGAVYHVTARGIEKGAIFKSDHDRTVFLEKLKGSVELHGVRLYAYVLMNNHFHLLLCTPRANLSAFMHQFNSSYTMYYNTAQQRVGHLYEGRYKAKVVQGDDYLFRLSRYIHLNPVKIKSVEGLSLLEKTSCLRDYIWSSFPVYAGLKPELSWVNYDALREQINGRFGRGEKSYQGYVEAGIAHDDTEFREILKQSTKAIGDSDFQREVELRYKEKANGSVDAAMRRIEIGIPLEDALRIISKGLGLSSENKTLIGADEDEKGMVLILLKEYTGLSQRVLAQRLLNHSDGSAASRYMKAVRQKMSDSPELHQKFFDVKTQVEISMRVRP